MSRGGKQLWAAVLLICVLAAGMIPAKADSGEYQQRLLRLYSNDPMGSAAEIEACLNALEAENVSQGKLWRRVMSGWAEMNHSGFASSRKLPEDLNQDDSLCIVVFGYGLSKNGTMKQELIERLQIALEAAQKYPNAYIAVTGGETSGIEGISEAAVMAIWLMNNGISEERIILEKKSLSTIDNAQNVYSLLNRNYPQILQLAVVTSDYHIAMAATMMQTACVYGAQMQGGQKIQVVAGASCKTDCSVASDYSSQAWGISVITGVD